MKKVIYDGEESLVMTRHEVEAMLLVYANNEARADELVLKETNAKIIESLKYQKIKARGFKEAIEGLMFTFTGKMINVDSNCKLITSAADTFDAIAKAEAAVITAASRDAAAAAYNTPTAAIKKDGKLK
ncbi:MAG: hypothetical protein GY797_33605 [Deltaproteobacteria bacterium]|nr:hypothetical protein [Deltaproteobacteria bacterium]